MASREGWIKPRVGRKHHWFRKGTSLCKGHGTVAADDSAVGEPPTDKKCKRCVRKLEAEGA